MPLAQADWADELGLEEEGCGEVRACGKVGFNACGQGFGLF